MQCTHKETKVEYTKEQELRLMLPLLVNVIPDWVNVSSRLWHTAAAAAATAAADVAAS